ncbi:M42 family metallopeptidase [soil metagenome]
MNIDLLRELTEAHGTSGYEGDLREIVRRELGGMAELSTDAMGSVIAKKAGEGKQKVMIAAHIDEIGFVVRFIDGSGFLRIAPMGGWDPRQMNSQRVIIKTKEGPRSGLLMYGTKPAHLLTDAEKNSGQKIDDFFVDVGLPVEAVKNEVRIGDSVTMDRPFQQTGDMLTAKAMDDRVGVFVMIEALKAVRGHSADIYAVATSQEEIGLRGASAAGWAIQPDVAIALDITLANDIPGVPEQDHITELGKGAAIKILDSSLICHPSIVDHFRTIAERDSIPHQMEILTRGGTDAGGIQRLHGGIPSFTLSIPCRYVHTPNESVNAKDVQSCIDLLARYIEEVGEADYSL